MIYDQSLRAGTDASIRRREKLQSGRVASKHSQIRSKFKRDDVSTYPGNIGCNVLLIEVAERRIRTGRTSETNINLGS